MADDSPPEAQVMTAASAERQGDEEEDDAQQDDGGGGGDAAAAADAPRAGQRDEGGARGSGGGQQRARGLRRGLRRSKSRPPPERERPGEGAEGANGGGGLLSAFGNAFRNFLADDDDEDVDLVDPLPPAGPSQASENEKLRRLLARKTELHRQEMSDREDEILALNDTCAMLRERLAHQAAPPGPGDADAGADKDAQLRRSEEERQAALARAAALEAEVRDLEAARKAEGSAAAAEATHLWYRIHSAEEALAAGARERTAELEAQRAAHDTEMAALRREHADALAALESRDAGAADAHARELRELREAQGRARADADAAVAEARAERDRAGASSAAEVERVKAECVDGIRQMREEHEARLRSLREEHEAASRRQREEAAREREDALRECKLRLQREQRERRLLHNMIQDLKGSIRVFVRVRPPVRGGGAGPPDGGAGGGSIETDDDEGEDSGRLRVRPPEARAMLDRGTAFEFSRVFRQGAGQADVFAEVRPLVRSVIDGYNVTIMAYGQTGSGKTHTMEGSAEDRGVNTRAIHDLFAMADELRAEAEAGGGAGPGVTIRVSALEIYNESLRDLLASDDAPSLGSIRYADKTGIEVPGLSVREIHSAAEVLSVLDESKKNRATAATNMNLHSSRSHALLSVYVTVAQTGPSGRPQTRTSKLHLIDLAGSERVSKSGVTGDDARLREATMINKSLSAIADVMAALQRKTSHVPYRNSKLTHFLQDSLGGNSKMLMFVMLSPDMDNVAETLSSLSFASRVQTVELGEAKRQKAQH